jgi:hypothetical protein
VPIDNPYLDHYRLLFGDGEPRPWDAQLHAGSHRELSLLYFAFAVPNDAALAALARRAPIVEMGAGGGYWASLLRQMNVDVLAFDRDPIQIPYAVSSVWTDVAVTTDPHQTIREHAGRTLFLCWPDDDSPFARDCLATYQDAGGQTLVYVGEPRGGCTAADAFFDLLAAHWREAEHVPLPTWPRFRDSLRVFVRTAA